MSDEVRTGSYVSDKRRKDVEGAVDHEVIREPGDESPWIEVWGNNKNYNINPILHHNIVMCDYFKIANREIHSYRKLLDEIENEVMHLEPYTINGPSKCASTAWCLLFKALMMRVTERQMSEMLDAAAPVYIRGVGFLYLRLTCMPKNLWGWFEPHMEDEQKIVVGRENGGAGSAAQTTVGKFLLQLLLDQEYCGTILPRLPVPVMRDIQAAIVEKKTGIKRAAVEKDAYTVGMKVRAQFWEDKQWYDNCQIDEVGHCRHSSEPPRAINAHQRKGQQRYSDSASWHLCRSCKLSDPVGCHPIFVIDRYDAADTVRKRVV